MVKKLCSRGGTNARRGRKARSKKKANEATEALKGVSGRVKKSKPGTVGKVMDEPRGSNTERAGVKAAHKGES